jgi:hypothetical protein
MGHSPKGDNMGIETTVRPARHMFRDIAEAYRTQAIAVPESVEDGFAKFERIVLYAKLYAKTFGDCR